MSNGLKQGMGMPRNMFRDMEKETIKRIQRIGVDFSIYSPPGFWNDSDSDEEEVEVIDMTNSRK